MTLQRTPTAQRVIGLAIKVHRLLGPGLLESAYRSCLRYELLRDGLDVASEVPIPVVYDGVVIDCAFKADLIVNETVLLELKSIARLAPVHRAQLMTYLKLTGIREGLLLNFNEPRLVDGLRSVLLDAPSPVPRLPGLADQT